MPTNHTLTDAITQLQSIVMNASGSQIKAAPQNPPEAINQYPFSIAYPSDGTIERQSDWTKGLQIIVLEIHFSRQNLPAAIALAAPYYEIVGDAILANPTLNASVSTVVEKIRTHFGFLPWGGSNDVNIGWRFEITVKLERTSTDPDSGGPV